MLPGMYNHWMKSSVLENLDVWPRLKIVVNVCTNSLQNYLSLTVTKSFKIL